MMAWKRLHTTPVCCQRQLLLIRVHLALHCQLVICVALVASEHLQRHHSAHEPALVNQRS